MSGASPRLRKKHSKKRLSKQRLSRHSSSKSIDNDPERRLSDPDEQAPLPPSGSRSESEIAEDEMDQAAEDADDLLLDSDEKSKKKIDRKKTAAKLKSSKRHSSIEKIKIKRESFDGSYDDSWFKMRECLMLTLNARVMLKSLILFKLKQERIMLGTLSVDEIQNLLKSQEEDDETDWIQEIQELKRNLIHEVRTNHKIELELTDLDKRISLLIKNRGNIQELVAGSKKSKKKADKSEKVVELSARKIEGYQHLFYLLQTEPKYLANLVYLMQPEQMESFLDTVILTLYGDSFSPREEFLILQLFSESIKKELSSISNMNKFLSQDSVVPKMVITYNKRKQGQEFLKSVIGPVLVKFLKQDVNLEVKPLNIYNMMISEQEIESGEKSNYDRTLNEKQIVELPEVKKILAERFSHIETICQTLLDAIVDNLKKLPYGIRYICRRIRELAHEKFGAKTSEIDIYRVAGYFVYYRFINLAIVTPDAFEIIDREMSPLSRKNLATIAKVLQYLFNFSEFGNADKAMKPMNDWITARSSIIKDYFTDLMEVPNPEQYLQVDKYIELTQKTKPIIIISLREISRTHEFLLDNIDRLVQDKEDRLRVVLNELADVPAISDEDDREIQLTLLNKFDKSVEDDNDPNAALFAETKEFIINAFKQIPVQDSGDEEVTLTSILKAGKKYAKEKNNSVLEESITRIFDNLKKLDEAGLVSAADNYTAFLKNIALEVANRAEIREQQRAEIKRLTQTLRGLRKHQKYLKEQEKQYRDYLQDCRVQQYKPKTLRKKKKNQDNPNMIGPFKFSYSALAKKGVIIDSDVPQFSRKKCNFYISSEQVGVFDIVAKIAGATVQTMQIEMDDLLEKNYNNINRYELNQVTLDVNMTIYLINKFFLK